jgi:hypothetical protein
VLSNMLKVLGMVMWGSVLEKIELSCKRLDSSERSRSSK